MRSMVEGACRTRSVRGPPPPPSFGRSPSPCRGGFESPMTDFLLELRSEEIPARMQAKAREDLAKGACAAWMDKHGWAA